MDAGSCKKLSVSRVADTSWVRARYTTICKAGGTGHRRRGPSSIVGRECKTPLLQADEIRTQLLLAEVNRLEGVVGEAAPETTSREDKMIRWSVLSVGAVASPGVLPKFEEEMLWIFDEVGGSWGDASVRRSRSSSRRSLVRRSNCLFVVAHSLVRDLPDGTGEAMGNGPDGRYIRAMMLTPNLPIDLLDFFTRWNAGIILR